MKPLSGVFHVALLALVAGEKGVRVGREVALEAQVADLQWLGPRKSVILLQTHEGRLHRSTDGGETWADISPSLSARPTAVAVRRLWRSPADPGTVFAMGAGLESFFSSDAGQTWSRLELTARINGFSFHASQPAWALLSHWTDSCGRSEPKTSPCSHNLYITKDLGKTLTLVCSHVVQFSWGMNIFSQQDRVYFTHFRDKSVDQPRLTRWMEGIDFAFTDNLGQQVTSLVAEGNKFQLSHNFILVVKVTNPTKQNVTLMISSDGGSQFNAAKLPHTLWQHSYALLDASEGALILHVTQGRDIGDIYISDRTGVNFSLSLSHNVRHGGLCAFEKVMNLNGIYIANVDEKDAGQQEPPTEESPEVEASSTGTQTDEVRSFRWRRLREAAAVQASPWEEAEGAEASSTETQADRLRGLRGRRLRRLAAGGANSQVRTVISFDSGGEWTYLRPPEKDALGNPIKCPRESCWLHLHAFTEIPSFAPVYSYKNAVGIIMGTGNIGPYLSYRQEDTNTYLSRDGGMTWMEAHRGTFIYEFGNHGGLLVMVDMKEHTQEAVFSWDEGRSWNTFSVSQAPVKVDNVIIEPDAAATKFLLYGRRSNGGGLVRLLDFSGVHQRLCQGLALANSTGSDYEKWTVPCILGQRVVYTRRKQLSECFNNETTERPITRESCECQQGSFECEVGFTRTVGSMECRLEAPAALPPGTLDVCGRGKEFSAKAYRKVPGDACHGGWQPKLAVLPCPGNSTFAAQAPTAASGDGSLPMKVFVVIVIVVAGLGIARSDSIRSWFQDMKGGQNSVPPPPGGARECTGTRIGQPSASGSELVGLTGSTGIGQSSYRPPTL